MEFVLKTRANSSALLALLPANEAMHVPSPNVCTPLDKSWAHSFSAQPHDGICPVKPRAKTFVNSHYISLPPNTNGALPKHGFLSVHHVQASITLPPTELSPSYFPRFPSVHHVHTSVSLLRNEDLPKLFPTVSRPSALSSLKCRSPCGKVN